MKTLFFQTSLWLILLNPVSPLLLPNIALNKTTFMSSTFSNFTSSNKAVDGQKTDLSYSGGQCAISDNGYKTAEWRVDLENLCSISNITIYLRTENSPWGENNGHTSRFLGFSIFISNTTMKEDGWLCFHDNSFYNITTIPAILTLECIMHGRYVIYYNERKEGQPPYYSVQAIIELCELEVNGCLRGQYGENCTEKCRENCVNDTCDINSGTCFACDVGYREPHCDLECDGGMYGPGCSLTCGACINNTQCHHINGSCLQGCGPGFYGRKCDEECSFGKYGINCQYNCSAACKSPYNCSRTTGECVEGCQPGWKGFHCDHTNIALNKATYISSQYDQSTGSEKAVDGGKTPTYSGGQCAISFGGQTALWRVDLGYLGSIHHIIIYPRTDNQPWNENNGHVNRLLGFSVYVSNTTDKEDGSICFYDNEFYTPSTIPEMPTLNCKMHGRYVIFYNERKQGQPSYYSSEAFVELCEFEIYGCLRNVYGDNCTGTCPVNCLNEICDIISGACFFCDIGYQGPRCENECDGGMYGLECNQICGACINNTQCHHINGSCLQGCDPGYKGQKCDKECDGGMYGPGCSLSCGACINNTQCHHINGSCLQGCGPGYKGQKCEEECDNGIYGPGCSLTCGVCINNTHCHHLNGSCLQGCGPGYKGQKCDEECSSGTYGINCRETCSINCDVSKNCNRTTGECFGGCQSGWKGFHCDQKCNKGTYGKDCQHRCGSCINQTHCHYVNGTCFEGCGPGYLGDKCFDECPTGKFGNNCNNTCSVNCKDNLKKCDVTSGDCESGCLDGWHGKHCDRKCDNGTYGKDCTNKCGNCQQQPCHHTNGTCLSGCSSSYKGETCKEEIKNPTNIVAIVGGVLGTIFCGAIILMIGLIYRRWRSGDKASNSDRPLVYMKPSANQGFSSLPENDPKSTFHRFDNQLSSCVKDVGDVYENEEHLLDIYIDQIKQAIEERTKDKNAGFIKEYSLLPYGEKYPCSVGKRPENVTKNRFKTTFPYDHSRVVLKVDDAIPSDYINANYIDGPQREQEYIASQGPKHNSVNDFWGMIWQTNTTQIVMLTNLVEGTKVKCTKYWPDRGVEKECGNLRIKLEKETHYAFYVVRKFKVFHKKANTSRTLTQYHYTSWPDHGTPEPLFLVIFHRHVIASRSPEDTSPTIVHCSAGIGRTGTYIALDALSKAGKMTGKINVTEYVKSMRTDRMNMVQTYEQYKTIFQALHDVFRAPIQSLNISDFVKKVENMSKEEPANWTVIRKEFQQLLAILPVYQQEDYKLAKQNKPPTCSDKILPLDKFNLNLTPLPDHRNCFINAIYLSSYTKEHVFIVTQYPENAVDFLRLLNDHESNYVILLDPSDEIEKINTWLPSTPKPEFISPFTFRFQSVSNTDLKLRTFLVDQNEQDTKTIVVAEPNKSLKLESGKQDTSSVRALVNYTLGVSPENTITIVSRDGAELCGMFCAIHNCMQQLHMDGNIDVFSTVRQLQIWRPELCSSQDEYSLIYKAIKDQIQSENENLYSNM